jgi:hypothetical protein
VATTIEHLYTRIYEVLCDGKGVARTIPEAFRFQRRYTSTADATVLSTRAVAKPLVYVARRRSPVDLGAADELYDSHLYRVELAIVRYYHAGWEGGLSAAEARAFDDMCRVRAALCHPGNLLVTEDGKETGIAAPALRAVTLGEQQAAEDLGNGRDRLLREVDTYEAAFDYSPDA